MPYYAPIYPFTHKNIAYLKDIFTIDNKTSISSRKYPPTISFYISFLTYISTYPDSNFYIRKNTRSTLSIFSSPIMDNIKISRIPFSSNSYIWKQCIQGKCMLYRKKKKKKDNFFPNLLPPIFPFLLVTSIHEAFHRRLHALYRFERWP